MITLAPSHQLIVTFNKVPFELRFKLFAARAAYFVKYTTLVLE